MCCSPARLFAAAPLGVAAAFLTLAGSAPAGEVEFPYPATVVSDGAVVRSGADATFYATGKLAAGTTVRVMRHDPGGWSMIEPPPGSFSYIRPEMVRMVDATRGVVALTPNPDGAPSKAAVRIGSQLSNDAFHSGRWLGNGESVRVLGRAVVNVGGGQSREMLRIAPPPREYRWVRGDALAGPHDESLVAGLDATQPASLTPGDDPSIVTGGGGETIPFGGPAMSLDAETVEETFVDTTRLEAEVDRTIGSGAARRTGPTAEQAIREQRQLRAIDDRFRAMVQADPGTWDLDGLERDYTALHEATASDTTRALVAKRLAAVQRRREVFRQYEEFVRLTSKTSERERELLEQQRQAERRLQELQQPVSLGNAMQAGPVGEVIETAPPQTAVPPLRGSEGVTNPSASAGGSVRFDGAGLVVPQRSPLGLTRYVLVSPTGKTLAIVEPAPGVDLGPHLNQPRGLVGDRSFDPAAGLDRIVVRRLQPVQLTK